jgi:hypothetical protein
MDYAQLFIETPYRNATLARCNLLATCRDDTTAVRMPWI